MAEKRKLFEEVMTDQRPKIPKGAITRARKAWRRAIRLWLVLLFALATALTRSAGHSGDLLLARSLACSA